MRRLATKSGLAFLLLLSLVPTLGSAEEPEFKPLFNGRDLMGWDGDPQLWKVEDGAIVGSTTGPEQLQFNQFLVWRGSGENDNTVENFELRVKCQLTNGNSGIQYRCKELPEVGKWSIGGYQFDVVGNPHYLGMLFEERGRGMLAFHGQQVIIDEKGERWLTGTLPAVAAKTGDWHEYTIIAQGNKLIHKIDGQTTTEIIDHQDAKRALKGLVALQLHRGPAMRVAYKDIMLKPLPVGGVLNASDAPVPQNATKVEKPVGTKPASAEKKPAAVKENVAKTPAKELVVAAVDKPSSWIWTKTPSGPAKLQLKKTFELKAGPLKAATLRATGDDQARVALNGVQVLNVENWRVAGKVDLKAQLRPGSNELLVDAANVGGQGGFTAVLTLEFEDGSREQIATDASWLVATAGSNDWQPARELKAYGERPWGDVLGVLPTSANSKTQPTTEPVAPTIQTSPGFQVDLLYTVPKEEQGSWVSMTEDDRGRLITCDQYGGLYRITPPAIGKPGPAQVEKLTAEISGAHGLLFANGSLYAMVNEKPLTSGLWRLRDANGDDQFDESTLLREIKGRGDHGTHALVLSPDGKSIYIACGNGTEAPQPLEHQRLPRPFADDQVLPRLGQGGAMSETHPQGYVCKVSLDGQRFEMVAAGLRNQYDLAFNELGDLFTYDSDMEWDVGTPWYRPTRIYHLVSAADAGFRETSGKFPAYYHDAIPPALEVGPGSPTGVVSGQGTKFPARYQRAIFAADWTYGSIYAVHLTPRGASYAAELEELVIGKPLPATDLVVGRDGALYFAVGGRRTQSALYRVTYVGKESTAPATPLAETAEHKLRVELEKLHEAGASAIDTAWPHLGHADRMVRYAARVAIERQPAKLWAERALAEKQGWSLLTSGLAVARMGGADFQTSLLEKLNQVDAKKLHTDQLLALVRVYEVSIARSGVPQGDILAQTIARLEELLPAKSAELNHELARTLVALGSPNVVSKALRLLATARNGDAGAAYAQRLIRNKGYAARFLHTGESKPNVDQIHYAFALRMAKQGWTPELRREFFGWFPTTAKWQGGNQFRGFLDRIRAESLAGVPDEKERAELEALSKVEVITPGKGIAPPQGPGREYTVSDVLALADGHLQKRNFQRGRELFIVGTCYSCHRLAGEGGGVGPDLTTSASRYTLPDLLENIVEPSKVISDQYESIILERTDGIVVVGRVLGEESGTLLVAANAAQPNEVTEIKLSDIESRQRSPVSLMPLKLLNTMNAEEALDLIAYILSGGDPEHALFK